MLLEIKRLTSYNEENKAYFNAQSGRAFADSKGRVYGEAADRLAWIEDMIAEGRFDRVVDAYSGKCNSFVLGQRIKTLAQQKGYTSAQLATFVDVNEEQITRLMKGDAYASFNQINAIAHALNTTVAELLAEK